MSKSILAALALGVCLCTPAWAQEPVVKHTDISEWPTLRVTVEVPQKSIDASQYKLRLNANEDLISPVRVTELSSDNNPAHIVIALDTSRSLSPEHLKAAKNALSRYLDDLDKGEQLALLSFNDKVELASGFTEDRAAFKASLDTLHLEGQNTELYQSMLYGLELLKSIPGQRALLVVTDGKDEGSAATREQVLATARENGVHIMAIGLPTLPQEESSRYLPMLEHVATTSGGVYRSAANAAALGTASYEMLIEHRALPGSRLYELVFNVPATMAGVRPAQASLVYSNESGITPVAFSLGNVPAVAARTTLATPATYTPTTATNSAVALALTEAAQTVAATPFVRESRPVVVRVEETRTAPAALVTEEIPARVTAADITPVRAVNNEAVVVTENDGISFFSRYWPWLLLGLLLLLLAIYLMARPKTEEKDDEGYVIDFPSLNKSFRLRPGTMIMGSGPNSDIFIDDPDLPEAHVEFCVAEDCRLTNKTPTHDVLLNGEPIVESTRLKPGDIIQFGNTRALIRRAEATDPVRSNVKPGMEIRSH